MNDVYFEKILIKIVLTVNHQVIVKNVKDHHLIKVIRSFKRLIFIINFLDSDVPIRPFNPDAQIFQPIPDNLDTISLFSNSINSLISLSPTSPNNTNLNSSSGSSSSGLGASTNLSTWTSNEPSVTPTLSSPTVPTNSNPAFITKPISTPVFSPQTFAQTKFGSLKSKHAGKRTQSK